jgi:hypothetical protein
MRPHLDIALDPWHTLYVRTTLTIDDDLLAAAKSLARANSESVGRVLSDLARRGLRVTSQVDIQHEGIFPVFSVPIDAHPITLEDVRRWEEEA